MDELRRGLALLLVALLICPPAAIVRSGFAQDAPAAGAQGQQTYGKEQLQQLVAPIALYPDSLLAQILMASTYPLEVVEAARWVKANPKVTGKALEDAMQKQSWDASVKSLTAFPDVLAMMDEQLSWTTDLGNAFLAQQADVMDAVQALRAKAQAEGNLKSTEQQTVTVEQQPSGSQPQTIIIQPANPQVVYVPAYNPTVVYGTWPYPSYPPYPYYPPGYAVAGSLLTFGAGMAVGAALWGNCNWGGGNVNVNVNHYNNYNRTNINNSNWQHNSEHRRGAQYNNQNVANKYGRGTQGNAQSREQFRGRAEQGRQQISHGDADRFKGQQGQRPGQQAKGSANRGQAGNQQQRGGGNQQQRGGGNQQQRGGGNQQQRGGGNRQAAAKHDSGAFGGAGKGQQTRQQSSRGQASRQSAVSHGGGGSRSYGGGGGGRSHGGGGHGGGGHGGGGRGGGGGGRGGGGRR